MRLITYFLKEESLPAFRDANKRQKKVGGGRNQSVIIYTTKRQKSRVKGMGATHGLIVKNFCQVKRSHTNI